MDISKKIKKIMLFSYIFILIGTTIIIFSLNMDVELYIKLIAVPIVPLIILIPIFLPLLIFKLGAKKAQKESMSKIDFKKEKNYYRDIIKNYSIAELSYIDNLQNLEEKDVCATLLSLELKKKIKIENKKIDIIDESTTNLKPSEIYIFEHISNNKVKNINLKRFTYIARNEALQDGFIKQDVFNKAPKDIISVIIGYIVITFINAIVNSIISSNVDVQNAFMSLMDLLNIITTIIITYGKFFIIGYIVVRLFAFSRTNNGEDINVKLEGLKIFIKDFGNFEDRKKEELILWEDYLIYSVLFNIDKKAINELKKYV